MKVSFYKFITANYSRLGISRFRTANKTQAPIPAVKIYPNQPVPKLMCNKPNNQ